MRGHRIPFFCSPSTIPNSHHSYPFGRVGITHAFAPCVWDEDVSNDWNALTDVDDGIGTFLHILVKVQVKKCGVRGNPHNHHYLGCVA
jgi:hypothetical protein